MFNQSINNQSTPSTTIDINLNTHLNTELDSLMALSRHHYENFPVAPFIYSKKIKGALRVIYAFARSADDIADEGDFTPEVRKANLLHYRDQLDLIAQGLGGVTIQRTTQNKYINAFQNASQWDGIYLSFGSIETKSERSPLFRSLEDVISVHQLPMEPFYDLLDAFYQDTFKESYESEAELLDYCRRSANPVGRIVLHLLVKKPSELQLRYSDDICTALQLINFMQDIDSDQRDRRRSYIPKDDEAKAKNTQELLGMQWERACALLTQGARLCPLLSGRLKLIILITVSCAARVLKRLKMREDISMRMILRKVDWPMIILNALMQKPLRDLP